MHATTVSFDATTVSRVHQCDILTICGVDRHHASFARRCEKTSLTCVLPPEICSTVHAVDRVEAAALGTNEGIWVVHSGWQGFGDVGTTFVRALSPGPHRSEKTFCTSSAPGKKSRELSLLQRNDGTKSSRQHQKYFDLAGHTAKGIANLNINGCKRYC